MDEFFYHLFFLHVDNHFHVVTPGRSATLVEDRDAVGQLAHGLDVARHFFGCEKFWVERSHQSNRVVDMDSLKPKLLAIGSESRRKDVVEELSLRSFDVG